MLNFKIQAFCRHCNNTSWLDITDQLSSNRRKSISKKYDAKNRSRIYAVNHKDHILAIEVDENGYVREEYVIDVITEFVEKVIKETVSSIATVNSKAQRGTTIVFLSRAQSFYNIVNSIALELLSESTNSILSIYKSKNKIILKCGNVSFYYINSITWLRKGKFNRIDTLVVDTGTIKEEDVLHEIGNNSVTHSDIIIAYNSQFQKIPPTILLNKSLQQLTRSISLFDYSTIKGLENIILAGLKE